MTPLVPPPVPTPAKIDGATGFALLEYPVGIAVPTPVLANGTPLTALDAASGAYLLDRTIAQQMFSYGVLLYRVNASGTVDVYDGAAWTPEPALDLMYAGLKPVELAFDTVKNRWTSIFMLSTVAGASDPAFATQRTTYRPAYGFLTVFRSPKSTPVIAGRSPLGTPFCVTSTADSAKVQPTPVQHLTPTSDVAAADGFAVFVKNGSGLPAADFVVSGDASLPSPVMLRFYAGGIVRASVTLDIGGGIHLASAGVIAIDAPLVDVSGELRARNVRYRPFDGSPERYL
jgi:hypothetical protein